MAMFSVLGLTLSFGIASYTLTRVSVESVENVATYYGSIAAKNLSKSALNHYLHKIKKDPTLTGTFGDTNGYYDGGSVDITITDLGGDNRQVDVSSDYYGNTHSAIAKIIVTAEGESTKNLLFVVGNTSLSATDVDKRTMLESFGYTVIPIDDNSSQSTIDDALDTCMVAYISESISSGTLSTKFNGATIGVLNEEGDLNDELGISADAYWLNGQLLDIVNGTHYITSPFNSTSFNLSHAVESLCRLDGAFAGGLVVLAKWSPTESTLGVIETGGALWGGGNAAGRRVETPWGHGVSGTWGPAFDVTDLTGKGLTLVERSVRWAADDTTSKDKTVLFVVGNDAGLIDQDSMDIAAIETWGYTVDIIDDGESQSTYDAAIATSDVVYVAESTVSSSLNSKLNATTLAVLTEEAKICDDMFLASDVDFETTSTFNITDDSHYITRTLGTGNQTVVNSSQELCAIVGTPAPGMQILGTLNGTSALGVMDTGDGLYGGGNAAGPRVILIMGRQDAHDFNGITIEGLTIMRRALQWGTGDTLGVGGDRNSVALISIYE